MMRLLIGVYLFVGLAELTAAVAVGIATIYSKHGGPEMVLIPAIIGVLACLPLLTAWGLWQRWRLVRLVLLVISWWNLIVSVPVGLVATATLIGLTDGRELGLNEPPGETLAMVLGLIAFAGWQAWVLMRPAVRESFRRVSPAGPRSAPKTPRRG